MAYLSLRYFGLETSVSAGSGMGRDPPHCPNGNPGRTHFFTEWEIVCVPTSFEFSGSDCRLLDADAGVPDHFAHAGDLRFHHGGKLLRRVADGFHPQPEDLLPGARAVQKPQYLLVQPRDDGPRRRSRGERREDRDRLVARQVEAPKWADRR